MQEIYESQPENGPGIWNRLNYRPLEGFVYAVSPFNFTAIAGNLCTSAAMMGNTVVWKPSDHQIFSAQVLMEIFKEAGLPDGVINMVFGDPEMITNKVLESPEFAGIHYTGSTEVFRGIWGKIGTHIARYKSYPRIVGETGGKDFIVAHPSSNTQEVATGIIRGAFEFQGQKCSAASRIYLPESIAEEVIEFVKAELKTIKVGSPEDFENFVTAVIHRGAFDQLAATIEQVHKDSDAEIIAGGNYDDSVGYFIQPTVVRTTNPQYTTMTKELFGPLVTLYVYADKEWTKTLQLVNETSEYALTGAVYSQDRYALEEALSALENAAGNFYINDKPTGAVVGQQPFGGGRGSGTNDKAGSATNLLRWVSPRLIKETFVPAKDYRYPFLGK
jgi:1-pyrroline-5-carboxylate dehydrogenase